MAQFKSQVLTQASGSVGGLTYSHGPGGLIMRARTIPITARSARKQSALSAFASGVSNWTETLTAAQRAAWNLYAANVAVKNPLGDARPISGQNWFIQAFTLYTLVTRTHASATLLFPATAPTTFAQGTVTNFRLISTTIGSQAITYGWDLPEPWNITTGGLALFLDRPINASRATNRGHWQFAAWLDGDDFATSPETFSITFLTSYRFAAGQRLDVKAIAIEPDYRISQPVLATIIAA